MDRKAKYIAVFCILVAFCLFFAAVCYVKTPEYIHKYSTPLYEEEAERFFYENTDVLSELIDVLGELDSDTWYYYTLHVGNKQSNPPVTPDALTHIFLKLEERTDQPYHIVIIKSTITIVIGSDTYFDVYLYYGDDQLHSATPGWDKHIDLVSDWKVHSLYIIRG